MKTKQLALASSLIILMVLVTISSAATISGYVVDETGLEPLPVATVVVPGTDLGTATNLDGYFAIIGIEPGNYKILVSYLGFQSAEIEVTVFDDRTPPLTIELQPSSIRLQEVEVRINRSETGAERVSPRVSTVPVDAKLVRTMPSMAGEMDVLRALQTIPGVKSSSDISSALYVRGGSPDQTLIMLDHNVVYNPSHLFGIFSTFNADAVKHMELMKGGFPAEYGGRSGSVLEVIANEGNRRKSEGLVSLGIVSARASLEGPLPNNRGSYAGSFRRTYMDLALDAIRPVVDIDVPDYYFYDANSKMNLDLTDRTTLTVAGYWGNDRLDFDFGPEDSRIHMLMAWGNRTMSTRLRHALGNNMFLSVSGALSQYHSDWNIENEKIVIDKAKDRLDDLSLKSNLEIFSDDHLIKTGFWISRYDIQFNEKSENITYVDVDEGTNNYAFYVQDRWRVTPVIEVLPGLRAYYHEAGKHTALDPRLSMVYHYSPQIRFKLAGGRYSQFINLISFGEGFSVFDIWIPIDETMKPTYSDQVVLGFEWDREDGIEFTTEAYYTDMNNITTFNSETDEGENAIDAFLVGEGYATGLEWMLRKNHGRVTGWIGYSLSWTERHFPNSSINSGEWYYPKWDRRHDFISVVNYKLSHSWDMSTSWRYNTGQGFTQALGIGEQRFAGVPEDFLDNNGRYTLPGSLNNYRFPSDHRLDLTFTYNHLFMKKLAKLNISIYNAYSRRSYWMRSYNTMKNPVEVTDVKLLPILPLVSYEVRF